MYDINYSSLEETVKKYILLIFFPIFKIIFIEKKEKKTMLQKFYLTFSTCSQEFILLLIVSSIMNNSV